MIFQEGSDMMETVIDPMLLAFYIIASLIFGISSYKKADLRLFTIAILLMTGAIVWCMIDVEIIEAIFVLTASVVAVISAVMIRMKNRKLDV